MNRRLFLFPLFAALVLSSGCAVDADDDDGASAPLELAAASSPGSSSSSSSGSTSGTGFTIPANYKQFYSFAGVAGEGYRLELVAETSLGLSVTAPGITINSTGRSIRINRFSPGSDGRVKLTVTNNTNAEQSFTLKVTRVP